MFGLDALLEPLQQPFANLILPRYDCRKNLQQGVMPLMAQHFFEDLFLLISWTLAGAAIRYLILPQKNT